MPSEKSLELQDGHHHDEENSHPNQFSNTSLHPLPSFAYSEKSHLLMNSTSSTQHHKDSLYKKMSLHDDRHSLRDRHGHDHDTTLEVEELDVDGQVGASLRFSDDQQEDITNKQSNSNNGKFFHSERWRKIKATLWYLTKLLSGPIVALPFLCNVLTPLGATVQINRCAAITVWIATYWLFEPIPISITSLLPVVLFPLLGVTSGKIIAEAYFSDLSFLFIGSFMVTISLEKWNLHRRFSLAILSFIGMRSHLILLGFMSISGFLSMWLSNTCTTAMLLPMANAVITSIKARNEENPNIEEREKESKKIKRLAKSLFLCIAYASSIMGCSTLIGTPTNLILVHVLNEKFPLLQTSEESPVTFLTWFLYAFPVSIIFLILAYVYFAVIFVRPIKMYQKSDFEVIQDSSMEISLAENPSMASLSNYQSDANLLENTEEETQITQTISEIKQKNTNMFREEYRKLGKIKFEEVILCIVFVVLCLLWIFRDLQFGTHHVGWNNLIYLISGRDEKEKSALMKYPSDGTVAVLIGILLFLIPSFNTPSINSEDNDKKKENQLTTGRILDWKLMKNEMPWDIILLLGCGFALAAAYNQCKFSDFIVDLVVVKFDLASKIHPYLMVFLVCFVVNILTEFSSNVGTASILMPLLATMSVRISENPLLFMAPATIASSLAFMTPIGTLANSLAFGYGHFTFIDMVVSGAILSIVGVCACTLGMMGLGTSVMGVSLGVLPEWANTTRIA